MLWWNSSGSIPFQIVMGKTWGFWNTKSPLFLPTSLTLMLTPSLHQPKKIWKSFDWVWNLADHKVWTRWNAGICEKSWRVRSFLYMHWWWTCMMYPCLLLHAAEQFRSCFRDWDSYCLWWLWTVCLCGRQIFRQCEVRVHDRRTSIYGELG